MTKSSGKQRSGRRPPPNTLPRVRRPQHPLLALRSQPTPRQLYVQNYAVAFFDLLGASNALKGLDSLNKDESKHEDVITAVERAWRPIWWMRQAFSDFFSTALHDNLMSPQAQQLPGREREQLMALLKKTVIGQSFSDCVVFSVPFHDPAQGYQPITSIATMLDACNAMVPVILASGEFMNPGVGTAPRGAVGLGAGAEFHEGEVLSAGLVWAYELEQKANWPRVLVGPTLLDCLHDVANATGDSIAETVGRELACKALRRIREDTEGYQYLDYLSPDLRASLGSYYDVLLPYAYRFSERKAAEFLDMGKPDIADKYKNVVDYFRERAPDIVEREPEVPAASEVTQL